MITVRVLFFSTIRARVGKKVIQIELPPGSSVGDLKGEIAQLYPEVVGILPSMLAAVNKVFSDDSTTIPDQAEVAFFPYVTGG